MTLSKREVRERLFHGDRIATDVDERADVVVIGSGPGGAATADLLGAAGLDVVVCEEGGWFDESDYNGSFPDMSRKLYRDAGGTIALGHPPIIIPLGKVVGGTAHINSGTCFRTPDHVLRQWALVHGVEAMSPEEMAPVFDEVERRLSVHELPREILGRNAFVVERGAKALGLNFRPLRHNGRDCRGCGTCTYGCADGGKQSPDAAYIPHFLGRGGRVYTRTRIERLLMRGRRAEGVEGRLCDALGQPTNRRFRVRAKLVVLAAGTISSPAFLLRNRVGLSSGEVGKNLTIHPAARVAALMDEEVRGWEGVPQGTYIDDFAKDGIMFEGIFVPPAVGAVTFPESGPALKSFMMNYSRVSMYGAMISDTSRGRVIYARKRPIMLYQMNRLDAERMLRAAVILCRVYAAAGAKRLYPKIGPMKEIGLGQIDEIARRKPRASDFEMMAFHPLGTCRMGGDPAKSVVDSWGKVHDAEGLFVIDGSVMPSPLGVNPQITIFAFAHRAARHIAANFSRYA